MNGTESLVDLDGVLRPAGEIEPARDEAAFFRGEGLYETILAVDGRMPFGAAHLARLRRSALELGLAPPPRPDSMGSRIRALLAANRLTEGPARVMLRLAKGRLLVTATPVAGDVALRRANGVSAMTAALDGPVGGGHKVLERDHLRGARARARREGHEEALLLDPHGHLLEGTTSTVFCVVGGDLVTPPLGFGILPGVTRARVLALATAAGRIPVERPVDVEELGTASEIFVTSAIRLLFPVVRVDGREVGDGRPGPVSRQLGRALATLVQETAG